MKRRDGGGRGLILDLGRNTYKRTTPAPTRTTTLSLPRRVDGKSARCLGTQ